MFICVVIKSHTHTHTHTEKECTCQHIELSITTVTLIYFGHMRYTSQTSTYYQNIAKLLTQPRNLPNWQVSFFSFFVLFLQCLILFIFIYFFFFSCSFLFTGEWLRNLFRNLTLRSDPCEQILEEVSFEGIAHYIKSGKCKKIITMAGAGISTCKFVFYFVFCFIRGMGGGFSVER